MLIKIKWLKLWDLAHFKPLKIKIILIVLCKELKKIHHLKEYIDNIWIEGEDSIEILINYDYSTFILINLNILYH